MLLQSPSHRLLLSLALLILLGNPSEVFFSNAFQFSSPPLTSLSTGKNIHYCKSRLYSILSNNSGNNNDDSEEEEEEHKQDADGGGDSNNNTIFAALPPIGTSSFWDRQDNEDSTETSNNMNLTSNNIVVSRKFHLSYTCKLCNTRNTHSITRLGYNHGVVIAICKQCTSKHLIADNLGWSNYLVSGFDYDGGERNIEDHVKNNNHHDGGGGSLRVERGVFDLESLWHDEKDENSDAVVMDEDGEDWN